MQGIKDDRQIRETNASSEIITSMRDNKRLLEENKTTFRAVITTKKTLAFRVRVGHKNLELITSSETIYELIFFNLKVCQE